MKLNWWLHRMISFLLWAFLELEIVLRLSHSRIFLEEVLLRLELVDQADQLILTGHPPHSYAGGVAGSGSGEACCLGWCWCYWDLRSQPWASVQWRSASNQAVNAVELWSLRWWQLYLGLVFVSWGLQRLGLDIKHHALLDYVRRGLLGASRWVSWSGLEVVKVISSQVVRRGTAACWLWRGNLSGAVDVFS